MRRFNQMKNNNNNNNSKKTKKQKQRKNRRDTHQNLRIVLGGKEILGVRCTLIG